MLNSDPYSDCQAVPLLVHKPMVKMPREFVVDPRAYAVLSYLTSKLGGLNLSEEKDGVETNHGQLQWIDQLRSASIG